MLIHKIFIQPEKSKLHVAEILTFAGFWPDKKLLIMPPLSTKAQGNRRMELSKTFMEERNKSYKNIMTDQGVKLRVNRSIQVEGAFGVLKNDYDFNRFLTRGKNNVKTEFLLLYLGYNLNKLHAKIQNDRLGKHLHPIKESA